MNKYRVIFHCNSGKNFRTTVACESLNEAKNKIKNVLDEVSGHFSVEGKNNRYFEVNEKNITFIEYEMLYNGEKISFQSLTDINLMTLNKILSHVDDTLIVKSTYQLTGKDKDVFSYALDMKRWEKINKQIKKIDHLNSEEIEEAQNKIIDIINRLIEKEEININ